MKISFLCGFPIFYPDQFLTLTIKELTNNHIPIQSVVFTDIFSLSLLKRSWIKYKSDILQQIFRQTQKYIKEKFLQTKRRIFTNDPADSPIYLINKFEIPHYTVRNFNNTKSLQLIKQLKPDILIPLGIGIVRQPILDIPRIATVNTHSAILPEYRGMNVIEWSLFHGSRLGITIHFMDKGIDTGDIIFRKYYDFVGGDTIESLRARSVVIGARTLTEALKLMSRGQVVPLKQNEGDGKQYYRMHDAIKRIINAELHKLSGK